MVIDHTALFDAWLDEMGLTELPAQARKEKAAELLGKTIRMVEYYQSGHEIPQTVLYLMDALDQGYRPRKWALRKR